MTLDLISSSGRKILWDILTSPGVEAVHLGCHAAPPAVPVRGRFQKKYGWQEFRSLLPCTQRSSLWRFLELRLTIRRRVDSASCLYAMAVEIIRWRNCHKVVISIENPANSWLWAVLVKLAKGTLHRSGDSPELCTVCLFSCLLPRLYTEKTYCLALKAWGV